MTGELGHGEGGADVPLLLVDAGGLPGQKQDKGDLDDLVGLEIQGEVGDDPDRASQFRLPPILSQGGQEQRNEAHTKATSHFQHFSTNSWKSTKVRTI